MPRSSKPSTRKTVRKDEIKVRPAQRAEELEASPLKSFDKTESAVCEKESQDTAKIRIE